MGIIFPQLRFSNLKTPNFKKMSQRLNNVEVNTNVKLECQD